MTEAGLTFAPLVPVPLIWALLAVAALAVVAAALYRLSGWWLRAAVFGVLALALAGPQLREEERQGLENVAFLVVDRSASTTLEDRTRQIAEAAESIAADIEALSGRGKALDLVTVEVETSPEAGDRGTQLLTALDEAAAAVAPGQIAGRFISARTSHQPSTRPTI